MPSLQSSAGSGKATKFVAANPLAPMADPFSGMDDSQAEHHHALADNVNQRLARAMDELKERHNAKLKSAVPQKGDGNLPGAAFSQFSSVDRPNHRSHSALANNQLSGSDDSDDEYDSLLDEGPEMAAIRAKRLHELREGQRQHAENLANGHGQYRLIYQDDFLLECTKSENVVVHFFHKEFERCKVMDSRLELIALRYTSCKFVKIDAEKAPFFVDKLQVKTLPTLLVFRNGKAVSRLIGFTGLAPDPNHPDTWDTDCLLSWLDTTGAVQYTPSSDDEMDEKKKGLSNKAASIVDGRRLHYTGFGLGDDI